MNKKAIYLLLVTVIFHFTANSKEIFLSDFGVKPWSYENASPSIAKALNSVKGEKNIVLKFPGGRIDLWPEGAVKKELYISNTTENDSLSKVKNLAICLENISDFTIEGNNTLVVLHGKMVSFAVLHSQNVSIKNIRFDYERPTMSELKIVEISNGKTRFEVHPDTRFDVENGKVLFYGEGWCSQDFHMVIARPDQDMIFRSSWKPFNQLEAAKESPNTIVFNGDVSGAGFLIGDVLTIRDPYRDNCGAFINQSQNVQLENVKMHYIHGMGIVSQFTENITFKKVEVVPREESGRVVSAFADCFHFSSCKGQITVDGCRTSGAHDDPMNVHGTHLKITKIEGRQLTVKFMHNQTWGFEAFFADDSVAFVKPENLLVYEFGMVKAAHMISKREMVLEIDGELPDEIKIGDCLENVSWTPSVIVRNCHFERTTTRGLLLTTRKSVLIENNTFYRTGMHAILIANDCNFWYESGPVQDVTIRGNKFIQCAFAQRSNGYVIAIQPETHNFKKSRFIHSNIHIENNTFECMGSSVLFARSVKNLWFNNNEIKYNSLSEPDEKIVARFKLEHCKDVSVEKNRFEGFFKTELEVSNMKESEVKTVPHNLFKN